MTAVGFVLLCMVWLAIQFDYPGHKFKNLTKMFWGIVLMLGVLLLAAGIGMWLWRIMP
jgi:protein-S-isoprenylcysteine O-methyltransferase Ste14